MPILYKGTTSVSLTKLTIHFLLLVQVVHISFGSISEDFGNVTFSANTNPNIRGHGNQGEITANTAPDIDSVDSKLILKANTRLIIKGSGNTLELARNTDCKIIGDRCNVVAEANTNLQVLGDGIKVTLSGTTNHVVRPSKRKRSAEIGSVNTLRISPSYSAETTRMKRSVESTLDENSDKFTIDFADEVAIDKNNYKLGLFAFTVNGSPAMGYIVKMDDSGMDEGSLAVDNVGHSEVVLSAIKEGVKHQLIVQGHSVKAMDGHEKTFHVKPAN